MTAVALLGAAAPAQAAPFLYVTKTKFLADTVSQYEVGAGGLLAPLAPPTVPTVRQPLSIAVSPDGQSVYVPSGCCGSGTVAQYDVGPEGSLSPKNPPSVATGPSALGVTVSPDGKSVYVASGSQGTVSQYDVDPGGRLSPKTPPAVPIGGYAEAVTVSPDGDSVYATALFGAGVSQYDVDPGGRLSPKTPATVAAGSYLDDVAVSPDGRSVYVANGVIDPGFPGNNTVFQYDVDAGGRLSPKTPAGVRAGPVPTALAMRPPPTKRGQCKRGGWRQLGFKSLGRCIRSTNQGPKK